MFPDELIARYSDYEIDPGDDVIPEAVVDASRRIAGIYAGLLSQEIEDVVVARAMMGATISLYDAMGLAEILPSVLRSIADRLEQNGPRRH